MLNTEQSYVNVFKVAINKLGDSVFRGFGVSFSEIENLRKNQIQSNQLDKHKMGNNSSAFSAASIASQVR